MSSFYKKHIQKLIKWPHGAIVFLFLAFISVGSLTVHNYLSLKEAVKNIRSESSNEVTLTKSTQAPSAEYIRPWMTIGFINKVFKLPDNYLLQSLEISAKSPNKLTIAKIAEQKQQSSDELQKQIQELIKNFISK